SLPSCVSTRTTLRPSGEVTRSCASTGTGSVSSATSTKTLIDVLPGVYILAVNHLPGDVHAQLNHPSLLPRRTGARCLLGQWIRVRTAYGTSFGIGHRDHRGRHRAAAGNVARADPHLESARPDIFAHRRGSHDREAARHHDIHG